MSLPEENLVVQNLLLYLISVTTTTSYFVKRNKSCSQCPGHLNHYSGEEGLRIGLLDVLEQLLISTSLLLLAT